jgi:hypothetical protein
MYFFSAAIDGRKRRITKWLKCAVERFLVTLQGVCCARRVFDGDWLNPCCSFYSRLVHPLTIPMILGRRVFFSMCKRGITMGMRIGGGGGWANHPTTTSVGAHQQRQQGVKNLLSALQSGDQSSAITAFNAMQNQGLPANSPFNAIGQALQNGDLAGAQKAAQGIMASRGRHADKAWGNGADTNAQQATAAMSPANVGANTPAVGAAVDPAAAFKSFMQTLEASLEAQSPSQTNAVSTGASGAAQPTTQTVLWSKESGFAKGATNAVLKADLDSLIQQLGADASTAASPSSAAVGASAAATPSVPSTASALESSFTNLLGSMGRQTSGASVMSFLKSLDDSLGSSNNALNVTA